MAGTVFAVAIVFVILVIATKSIGYYRGEFSVVGAEREGADVAPAALGAGVGVIVLLLLALLYAGVSQWDWFGHPAPKSPVVAVPRVQPSPALGHVGASPAPGVGASPAGQPSASPHP